MGHTGSETACTAAKPERIVDLAILNALGLRIGLGHDLLGIASIATPLLHEQEVVVRERLLKE